MYLLMERSAVVLRCIFMSKLKRIAVVVGQNFSHDMRPEDLD